MEACMFYNTKIINIIRIPRCLLLANCNTIITTILHLFCFYWVIFWIDIDTDEIEYPHT